MEIRKYVDIDHCSKMFPDNIYLSKNPIRQHPVCLTKVLLIFFMVVLPTTLGYGSYILSDT